MPEQTYFYDSAVQITSTEPWFGRIHLPVSEIRSARVEEVWPKKSTLHAVGWTLIVLGLTMTILQWFVIPQGTIAYTVVGATHNLIALLGFLALGIWARNARHIVKVAGSFGEKDVVVARHHAYARKVVKAIEAATKSASVGGALPVSQ